MSFLEKNAGNWFGFTRRERRSNFILLTIIVAVLAVRYIVPSRSIKIEEIPVGISYASFVQDTSAGIKRSRDVPVRRAVAPAKRPPAELNRSDSSALVALPGIGPVLSARIIKYRNLLGGFVSVEQLREVYGLPVETYNLICTRVSADSLLIRKIKINEAEYKDLIRHPYFKKNEVDAILKFRRLSGRINNAGEMIKNKLISEETCKKIKPYLEF